MVPARRLMRIVILTCGAALFRFAAAQDAWPVYVQFQFSEPMAAQACEVSDENRITEALVSSLTDRFRFWSFVPGSDHYPRMSIRFSRGVAWRLVTDFIPAPGAAKLANWPEADLLAPGSPEAAGGRLGPCDKLAEKTRKAFDERFLQAGEDRVREALQTFAPLGMEVKLKPPVPPPSADKARGVLPLRWDQYCQLAKARFRIECDSQEWGPVTLHSVGVGSKWQYPATQPFDGIEVRHEKWGNAGTEANIDCCLQKLPSLQPVRFFLEKPDSTAFITQCGTLTMPPPLQVR